LSAKPRANIHPERLERLLDDRKSTRIQNQLTAAADVVAARFHAGRQVGLSGVGHLILHETREEDFKCNWIRFRGRGKSFANHLAPGDLLVWIAYMGMNSAYHDYGKHIREAGLDLVTSYAPPPADYQYTGDTGEPLAHMDQCWEIGDAEVPVPGTPDRMAPVSGINRALLIRMLDDAVAERLAESATPPTPETP
jgi:uncharacterized phosphosugar-binding protein